MYTYQTNLAADKHDDFVKSSNQTNLLQSSQWSKIKENWHNKRVGFYKNEQLVAVASILIRPLPLGLTMFYIPRGPIMDYNDSTLVNFVLTSLKEIAKKHKALFISFDPNLILKEYKLGETVEDNPQTLEQLKHLQKAGAIWSGRTTDISATIQPRFQANVYTTKNIIDTFPKHTKRLMKDAQNRGVQTKRAFIDELESFSHVMSLTEERKGVALRNHDYYHKMMSIYGNDAYLYLAKVNLSNRLSEYKEQLILIQQELSETKPHQKKKLTKLSQQEVSVQKYITEFDNFVKQYPDEVTIAGILSIQFGNTMEMLYAGMNDDFKKFYPQYSLYPTVFEKAYQDDIIWANMGGIEGSLDDGLTKFKSNFSPTIQEYIGEFEIPVNHFLYKASKIAYRIRQKLRRKY